VRVNIPKCGGLISEHCYSTAVAIAPIALAAVTLFVLVFAVIGKDPVWAVGEMTISEAAATRDRGGVVRMIREGAKPNGRYSVRPEVIASAALVVTPLEAAALNRQDYMMELLFAHGATLPNQQRRRLMCFLYQRGSEDMYAFLAEFSPMDPPINCTCYEPYW